MVASALIFDTHTHTGTLPASALMTSRKTNDVCRGSSTIHSRTGTFSTCASIPRVARGHNVKVGPSKPFAKCRVPWIRIRWSPDGPDDGHELYLACRKVSYDIKHLQTLNTFRHLTPALSGGHRRRHGCGPHTNA